MEDHRPPPPPPPLAVAKVLDDDDLLAEILLRVGLPTTLVRAAAVCRRWLHQASGRKFLHRFRELHPPRLLGFYVFEEDWIAPPTTPRFVPLLPQPPELAAVISRASSSLNTDYSASIRMFDCRNGSMLISRDDDDSGYIFGVHSLLCPERGMDIIPPFPCDQHRSGFYNAILSKEEGHGLSYFYVLMLNTAERKHEVQVHMLRDGVWCMHSLIIDHIPRPRSDPKAVLVDNKIYMPAAESDIVVLDLAASRLSTVHLPQGVEHGLGSTMLSRADGAAAGVYLIHVKELKLHVWLHKGDDWLLVDTICLREMGASLGMPDFIVSPRIKHVGDNAEFVFLDLGQSALHLDIKCMTLRKVYEVRDMYKYLGGIYPFVMIWPPTFPALKGDLARDAM